MKIIYIANIRIPTERAHGIQIMKMCEAFAVAGNEVELIVPRRFNNIKKDSFEYYDVKKNFKIKKLPTFDLVKFGKIGFLIQAVSFAKFITAYLLFKKVGPIYSRDEWSLWFLSFFKKNLIYEGHTVRNNFFTKHVLRKSKKIVVITQGLKDFYIKKFKINSNKILVASDGVDLSKFDIKENKNEIRKKLNIPLDKKIILYTGHLYPWKGVNTLIESMSFLKDKNADLYLVGGTDKDVDKLKKINKTDNIKILGRKSYKEIPYWQKLADVLILPNTAKEDISKYYTSPMKLFEYMASGNPIVASDLSSILEVLNESNSILVEPDNSEKLADGIQKVLNDIDLSQRISQQALEDVKKYTWDLRAKNILDFIKI